MSEQQVTVASGGGQQVTAQEPAGGLPQATAPMATVFEDAGAVRTSAQWLAAAAGAVAAALIAGLQIGAVGGLGDRPVALLLALVSFLVALAVVGMIIRASSRVLVPPRATISDLLEADTARDAHDRGVIPESSALARPPRWWRRSGSEKSADADAGPAPRTGIGAQLQPVIDEISRNREWLLLPGQRTTSELHAECRTAQQAAADDGGSSLRAEHLERRLAMVCSFARAELTRNAYRRLTDTMTGRPGWLFAAAVLTFAATLTWPHGEAPEVTTAYRLDVILTGTARQLRDAGLAGTCRPGTRLTGVAVDGDLAEPSVVTETAGGCPAARFTVTEDVGIPMPYVPAR